MTDSPPRYAVYYAPPADTPLWQLAQRWLGRDCETATDLEQPGLDGWSPEAVAAATESPRHYGFHATLKAPFCLAEGQSLETLYQQLAAFASRHSPFQVPPLRVSTIGSFIALTFSAPSPRMQALADAAVQELDGLRAPPTQAEIDRRLQAGLTPRQEALLRRWGYPYVLEEFRFHMTLTGSLGVVERRERLQTQLAVLFRPVLGEPVPVREISLYSQVDRGQPFRLVERFPLAAAVSDDTSAG